MGDWFADGLRFECTGCGECCTGASGYVWVDETEATAIAARLDLSIDDFGRRYLRRVGARLSLVERPDGSCALLDPASRRCTIYDDRPTQCRTYPFWRSIVADEEAWSREGTRCPGIGRGRRHDAEAIRTALRATGATR